MHIACFNVGVEWTMRHKACSGRAVIILFYNYAVGIPERDTHKKLSSDFPLFSSYFSKTVMPFLSGFKISRKICCFMSSISWYPNLNFDASLFDIVCDDVHNYLAAHCSSSVFSFSID